MSGICAEQALLLQVLPVFITILILSVAYVHVCLFAACGK
jgi:hypothetical protein